MEHVCVKVKYLRQRGFQDFSQWLADPNNLYVGRHGRIFIDKKIFHYSGSKWANPFPLKKYSLSRSLKLFEEHLTTSGLVNDLHELRGKHLGCFCGPDDPCHAKLLSRMVSSLPQPPERKRKIDSVESPVLEGSVIGKAESDQDQDHLEDKVAVTQQIKKKKRKKGSMAVDEPELKAKAEENDRSGVLPLPPPH